MLCAECMSLKMAISRNGDARKQWPVAIAKQTSWFDDKNG